MRPAAATLKGIGGQVGGHFQDLGNPEVLKLLGKEHGDAFNYLNHMASFSSSLKS